MNNYLVPVTGILYRLLMQIVAKKRLKKFWEKHPRVKIPLETWYAIVSKAEWKSPAEIKKMFGATVDFVAGNRVVFDISGNSYRLVVHISYEYKAVLIKFIGAHAQYDKIDVEHVS